MDFKYRVSVIVPVYNVEEYLAMCVDSLVNQTIDKSEMEILLINDGSPDNSLEICREYEKKYSCVKVFSKENEGLSATRNYGIKRAQGKYLMYIDSDDYLSPTTVKDVCDFFDTVYDEVDLVSYFEQPYDDCGYLAAHSRFKYYLKNNGVYNLEKYPYILQMRINVCVKNMGEENELFDTTPGFRQEDQEYNNRVLMKKMKLGYCSTGCYFYNKSNENSIVATTFNAINLFEKSMEYLERLSNYFDGDIPKYFQAIIFHDLKWKFEHGILLPHHYNDEDFAVAFRRIKNLLLKIDNSTIVNYPNIREEMVMYWLSIKDNANLIPYIRNRKIQIISDGNVIYKRTKMAFKFERFQPLDDGRILCRAHIITPLYNFVDEEPEIYVLENEQTEKRLKAYPSKHGYLCFKERVMNYYALEYVLDANEVNSFRFYVKFDGFEIVSTYEFFPLAVFNTEKKLYVSAFGDTEIELRNSTFYCKKITAEERDEIDTKNSYVAIRSGRNALSAGKSNSALDEDIQLRLNAIKYRKTHRVWLYSDLYTVEKDNGYYQFINDFDKNDGVERYYIYTRELSEIEYLFNEEQKKALVEFGSERHKLLYLSAEIIFSAFYGRSPISPFKFEYMEKSFYDMEHFKVIYLQHGVLHASLYVQNSAENARADKIVISSAFEKNNYIKNYHYDETMLIPSSMARFDHIDRTKAPKGKILFAPSWRNYLSKTVTASSWSTNPEALKKSDYFINMTAFLENEGLAEALEKSGLVLELKLHPIIADEASQLFNFTTKNIVLAERNVDVTDYDMFITDFSSFVFDYACLSRPIMYFVPDYIQFTAGLGHYRKLDLPFEDAFGRFTTDPEEAANIVIDAINSGFKVEDIYKERMDNFYYPLDNCANRLYDYINEHMLGEVK